MYKQIFILGDLPIKVYSDGRIETYDSNFISKSGRHFHRTGRFLKPAIDKDGYLRCGFSHKGKRKCFLVHQLVAIAYIPNPFNKNTVNHINGIKIDNRLENLEWATNKEQTAHATKMHLRDKNIEVLARRNIIKSIPIIYKGIKYKSLNEAHRATGLHPDTIRKYGEVLSNA